MRLEIELSPADLLALAGLDSAGAASGSDGGQTAPGPSSSDLMAVERVHECCRLLECEPIALVEKVRRLSEERDMLMFDFPSALVWGLYNGEYEQTPGGFRGAIATIMKETLQEPSVAQQQRRGRGARRRSA